MAMRAAWYGKLDGSPLGQVWAAVTEQGLAAVDFGVDEGSFIARLQQMGFREVVPDPAQVALPLQQIKEYLAGRRQVFDMPIDWSVMSGFQAEALRLTFAIPFGQVSTYGDLARQLGRPRAARAVGRAEATNPMPLVIPCHRVLGADGRLHGYGAGEGLKTKDWLLRFEGALALEDADHSVRWRLP